jgi:hypothetical protein
MEINNYALKHELCMFHVRLFFAFFLFFMKNPIVKPYVPVYNDIKNFILCYKI